MAQRKMLADIIGPNKFQTPEKQVKNALRKSAKEASTEEALLKEMSDVDGKIALPVLLDIMREIKFLIDMDIQTTYKSLTNLDFKEQLKIEKDIDEVFVIVGRVFNTYIVKMFEAISENKHTAINEKISAAKKKKEIILMENVIKEEITEQYVTHEVMKIVAIALTRIKDLSPPDLIDEKSLHYNKLVGRLKTAAFLAYAIHSLDDADKKQNADITGMVKMKFFMSELKIRSSLEVLINTVKFVQVTNDTINHWREVYRWLGGIVKRSSDRRPRDVNGAVLRKPDGSYMPSQCDEMLEKKTYKQEDEAFYEHFHMTKGDIGDAYERFHNQVGKIIQVYELAQAQIVKSEVSEFSVPATTASSSSPSATSALVLPVADQPSSEAPATSTVVLSVAEQPSSASSTPSTVVLPVADQPAMIASPPMANFSVPILHGMESKLEVVQAMLPFLMAIDVKMLKRLQVVAERQAHVVSEVPSVIDTVRHFQQVAEKLDKDKVTSAAEKNREKIDDLYNHLLKNELPPEFYMLRDKILYEARGVYQTYIGLPKQSLYKGVKSAFFGQQHRDEAQDLEKELSAFSTPKEQIMYLFEKRLDLLGDGSGNMQPAIEAVLLKVFKFLTEMPSLQDEKLLEAAIKPQQPKAKRSTTLRFLGDRSDEQALLSLSRVPEGSKPPTAGVGNK